MSEIRKLLADRGYGGIIGQLWHDCTPSVQACVRCATPFTADMGALFEWANYENRLVASKAGVVDNVVLINWMDRFAVAKLLPTGFARLKNGEAVITQVKCKFFKLQSNQVLSLVMQATRSTFLSRRWRCGRRNRIRRRCLRDSVE